MNRHLLECLLRLRSPEFDAYRAWLKQRREEAKEACTGLTGEALMRAQGKAGELKELIETIDKAPQLIDKFRNQL